MRKPNLPLIDHKPLSIIDRIAQDEDGSILAGARHLQATQGVLGIGTIYLRNPNNPRSMDRRIPVPIAVDDEGEPGPCESLPPLYYFLYLMTL